MLRLLTPRPPENGTSCHDIFQELFPQLEFTDSVNAPIGWGFLFREKLALRQFSSEYVCRLKTCNFSFFK